MSDIYVRLITERGGCIKVIGRVDTGDLLVPSPEPGRAQKRGLFRRRGPIIGKALSSTAFDKGKRTGTLDMLVTLD